MMIVEVALADDVVAVGVVVEVLRIGMSWVVRINSRHDLLLRIRDDLHAKGCPVRY